MPIEFWIDPDHHDVFRWKFSGKWTPEEYYTTNRQVIERIKERAPEPVYAIVDMTESSAPPTNFLGGLSASDRQGAENWKMTVIVTESPLITSLIQVGSRINKNLSQRFALARTLEEAYENIQAVRQA